jgi:hypothetical protein
VCSTVLVEKRKHYWNGRWGRLARHDILLFEDAGFWRVEDRIGGADGRSRWGEFEHEDAALDHVRDLVAGTDDWQELT